jgi:imidazolonepropionase-like amidohydrolase
VRRIGWTLAALAAPAAAQPPLAIVGATLIDGTGRPARPNVTVLVDQGRIRAIGAAVKVPADAIRIDGTARFLLPGFIDSNVHGTVYGNPARRDTSAKYGDRNEELALEFAQRSLKAGVTTVRDSYGVLAPLIAVRDRIASGQAVGSRLLVAGNIVGWGGSFSTTYSLGKESDLSFFQEKWNDLLAQDAGEELADMTPEELAPAMERYVDKGVDFVKYGGTSHFMFPSLIGFSPRQQKVIVDTAHARGKRVDTHATSPEGLRLAVEAGIDLIQHPELLSRDLPDDLTKLIVARGPLCGMRSNVYTGVARQKQLARRAEAEKMVARMPPPQTGAERRRRAEMLNEGVEIERRNAERLVKAGCPVTVATDNYLGDAPEFRRAPKPPEQEPGIGTLLAVQGLVELGMTPMQAIVAGTRNGAVAAGMARDLGTVEVGRIADLVLVGGDPLADIANIQKTEAVIAGGRVVDRDKLPGTTLFTVPAAR